ncbi:MAG: FG-GAP-like repeat-containing protein, partial [Saprospiraceae bacterium]
DGDGDLDIVVGKNSLVWYRNDDMIFKESFPIEDSSIGFGHYDVAAHDFDGDGDLDILSHALNIYFNDGNGNFQMVDVGNADFELEVKDVDNDGALDIIGVGSNEVNLYLNNGNGTFFYDQIASYADPYSWSVSVEDIDQDGFLDILIGFYDNGELRWYKGDGSGSFSEQVIIDTENIISQTKVFDVDGDGDQDFLIIKFTSPQIRWIEQEGNGTSNFLPEQDLLELPGSVVCHLGDMDNDNDLDILMTQTNTGRTWLENTGSGLTARTFTPPSIPYQGWPEAVSVIDLTGNGKSDIIHSGGFFTGSAYQNALGNFSVQGTNFFDTIPGGAFTNALADLDGDGQQEVIIASQHFLMGLGIKIYKYDIGGVLVFQELVDTLVAYDLEFGDFDEDGDVDIVAVLEADNKVNWYANDGTGAFSPAIEIDTPIEPQRLKVADLNQDGELDLIVGLRSGQIIWYEKEAGDSFSVAKTIEANTNTFTGFHARTSIDAADLDLDGDVDLVSNENLWYENIDGMGQFAAPVAIDENYTNTDDFNYPFSKVLLIDIDKDYDQDLVAHGDELAIYYNDGAGNFSAPESFDLVSQEFPVHDIEVSDFDGDQDEDLVLLFRTGFRISWLENQQEIEESINLIIDSTLCNNNGTELDGSDDYLEIYFHVDATNLDDTYAFTINNATIGSDYQYRLPQRITVPFSSLGNQDIVLQASDPIETVINSTITLENKGNCLLVGTNDLLDELASFRIFPNPSQHTAQVAMNLSEARTMTMNLRNSLGQKLPQYSITRNFQAGTQQLELPVAGLAAGLYFLEIQTDGQQHTMKLMVE